MLSKTTSAPAALDADDEEPEPEALEEPDAEPDVAEAEPEEPDPLTVWQVNQ